MISQKVLTRGDAGNASVVAQIDSYYQDKKMITIQEKINRASGKVSLQKN
jgi:hypothetical protein